ncbi:universal stress protein UspE [Psychrosphaera sp. F3M07]|uniref:universal stress protein UspE n=1 Tax=Psychrosphaera sp. F3M07 TaxID=2841560 RepID=UPI001C093404|nr:universal stress protein UspE [Psychrosphaera sp. F3M07]MBU2918734.1 universal stress protein UspE [Psychrosphaera sp. F3M07]
MSHFNKILVVIDPTEDNHKALSRALEMSEKHPCDITVFLTIYDFSYEMTTMLSSDERTVMQNAVLEDKKEWLIELIKQTKQNNTNISTEVVWHNRPYESITRAAIEGQFDLVIKSTHKHDSLKSVIFTPTDWHLLRKCPCPVLLVKDHAWPKNSKVLAAVSAGTDDASHALLNYEIINHACFMAGLLQSDTHLINAYPPTPMNIAVEIPEFDTVKYNENMKNHHQTSLSKLALDFNIDDNKTHIVEGLPEDVIPEVARTLDAELVVIGTVGRTGISAALIGNTAEHVIDNLNCDLLALKPPDFISPIKA